MNPPTWVVPSVWGVPPDTPGTSVISNLAAGHAGDAPVTSPPDTPGMHR